MRTIRWVVLIAALLGAGALVWVLFLKPGGGPKDILQVSGRIESDDSAVAAKVAGRLRDVTVREGDKVTAGQVIAHLDDAQTLAREEQSRSTLQQAEAKLKWSNQQIAVLNKQLEQSKLMTDQARIDAQGKVRQAEAQLAAAESSLAQAEATLEQARYDAAKFGTLAEQGAESERTAVQARTNQHAQEAAVAAARKQVDAYRGALETAKANLANPAIRSTQTAGILEQIRQAQADVEAANADRLRAEHQLAEAQANRNDLNIIAPFDATVAVRSAEPGEVVAAGTPIVTLVNFSLVYLRAYVPEGDIGRVVVGQPARVYLDSDPHHPWEAYVSRVDPEASFTPENTYFRNDRVKQVVGVKLLLKDPRGFAKPGMPADGEILVRGDNWETAKR